SCKKFVQAISDTTSDTIKPINLTFRKMRNSPPLGIVEFHARGWPTAREMQNPTRRNGPPLGKCRISRAGILHRSRNAESRAVEQSTARKMQNLTRRRAPPLGKCRIPRAGMVHRSENAESHAQGRSTAGEAQKHTRGHSPQLRHGSSALPLRD